MQRLTTHFHPRVRKYTVHIDISQDATKWTEILALKDGLKFSVNFIFIKLHKSVRQSVIKHKKGGSERVGST